MIVKVGIRGTAARQTR